MTKLVNYVQRLVVTLLVGSMLLGALIVTLLWLANPAIDLNGDDYGDTLLAAVDLHGDDYGDGWTSHIGVVL